MAVTTNDIKPARQMMMEHTLPAIPNGEIQPNTSLGSLPCFLMAMRSRIWAVLILNQVKKLLAEARANNQSKITSPLGATLTKARMLMTNTTTSAFSGTPFRVLENIRGPMPLAQMARKARDEAYMQEFAILFRKSSVNPSSSDMYFSGGVWDAHLH